MRKGLRGSVVEGLVAERLSLISCAPMTFFFFLLIWYTLQRIYTKPPGPKKNSPESPNSILIRNTDQRIKGLMLFLAIITPTLTSITQKLLGRSTPIYMKTKHLQKREDRSAKSRIQSSTQYTNPWLQLPTRDSSGVEL